MNTFTIIMLILIGLASGTLAGLVGVGGGIIIIPALVYILGFTQKEAQGTSLGILLLPVGILAVINYYKQGYIDIKAVIIISLAFVIGGFFGSKLALSISQDTLRKVFGTLLLVLAIKMLFIDK
ncbi:MAG TPA: sulfite exporter TauE/SafE family protein [Parafilimonas sp.]|jgi:uncharacterized protein|nr:sulfite exporter TauE/SafE family protein [Parafilimonas sp.]